MMALTHAFASLALAVAALPYVPGRVGAPLLLAAAFVGGLAPDADLLASHRKTLHYPVLAPIAALALGVGFFLTDSVALLLAAVGVGSAGLHALSDVLGGSAEREPWNPTTEHGVFNHVRGAWHRPRRVVRYSGAPEDFLVGAAFAAVAVSAPATSPAADAGLVALTAFAGGYSLCRKRLGEVPALVASVVPGRFRAVLPSVRVEETESDGTTVRVGFGR